MAEAPAGSPAIDRERMIEDLRDLVRVPSITGSEEAVAALAAEALRGLGLAVEVVSPDPASVRADEAWPGEEMPRTSLPVVIGRAGRPEEIASVVLWLCSPGASYVVGHALTVDGGMTVV